MYSGIAYHCIYISNYVFEFLRLQYYDIDGGFLQTCLNVIVILISEPRSVSAILS